MPRQRLGYKRERALAELPNKIEALQTEIAQLQAALANPQVTAIVIIPDESFTFTGVPDRLHDHIYIYDTRPAGQKQFVSVAGTLRVKVSGTATVVAWDTAQVTASGNAYVHTIG